MTPYQKDIFDYDDEGFVDSIFHNDETDRLDDDQQDDFGFDSRTNRIKKNVNYDQQDLKTLDVSRNKNRFFDKLVRSTKTYNFIAIWLNLIFLITFVLAIVFLYLNKFSFQQSESTYISVNLFLTIALAFVSYLISFILYGFVKMHNKRIKYSLTEKALDYYSIFKKSYVSYFLLGWIPLVGVISSVGSHIALQNLDDSEVSDNNLWYQESISDLMIDMDGYENSYRELESKKNYLDQELQRLNYEKQKLDAKKNELAVVSANSIPNFRNSKQLVNFVSDSGYLSAELVQQVKSAITQLREERRKLRRENRRLRALLSRANNIEEQPLLLTSSNNLYNDQDEADIFNLNDSSSRKNERLSLESFNDRIDWMGQNDNDDRELLEIGKRKKENAQKIRSTELAISKKNNQQAYKVNLIATKKDTKLDRYHEDDEVSKQSNLLSFVNAMDLNESTLSLDSLFNVEADDDAEDSSFNKKESTKPKTIKVKLSRTKATKNPNAVKKVTIS
ncbi:oligosaccharide repeat unit polymerase [Mycoplasma tullyi]|uniref:Oligosaccharide repeat unit polymerase n=1 Tax=Mycoplasma tullyi TaxID=1612150 RepID=A0A7D7U560_9MOLU|nr:O-antigen polymerase [Mycoplasma tullyi]QMT98710.1 oligosaccharide repeat unit polymerase [Mycoplasma tullyi]